MSKLTKSCHNCHKNNVKCNFDDQTSAARCRNCMKARLDCSDSTKSSEPDASKLEGHYGLVPQAGLDASLIGDMYDECIFLFQEAGDHAAHFPHFSVEKRIYHYSIDMAGRYEQTLKHPSHVKYIAQLSDVALSLQLTHANLLQAFNLIFVWADHIEFQDCSVLSQVAKTIEFFFRAIHRFDSDICKLLSNKTWPLYVSLTNSDLFTKVQVLTKLMREGKPFDWQWITEHINISKAAIANLKPENYLKLNTSIAVVRFKDVIEWTGTFPRNEFQAIIYLYAQLISNPSVVDDNTVTYDISAGGLFPIFTYDTDTSSNINAPSAANTSTPTTIDTAGSTEKVASFPTPLLSISQYQVFRSLHSRSRKGLGSNLSTSNPVFNDLAYMAEIASGRCIFTTSPCVQEILNWETSFEAYPKERGLSVDDGRVTEGWGGLWG